MKSLSLRSKNECGVADVVVTSAPPKKWTTAHLYRDASSLWRRFFIVRAERGGGAPVALRGVRRRVARNVPGKVERIRVEASGRLRGEEEWFK
jgi:hypothetical protein